MLSVGDVFLATGLGSLLNIEGMEVNDNDVEGSGRVISAVVARDSAVAAASGGSFRGNNGAWVC